MKLRILLLSCAVAVAGCDRTKTIGIGLDGDEFRIVTSGTDPSGVGSVLIDPDDAGQDYIDNRGDIDGVTLRSLKLEITQLNPANQATVLESGTLVLTDLDAVPPESHSYVVDPTRLPLDIAVTPLEADYYDLGLIANDPADPSPRGINDFLSSILKTGHLFRVEASGAVDAPPVDILCRLHFAIDMEISIGLFD